MGNEKLPISWKWAVVEQNGVKFWMQMQLSWMVKANEYKKPVTLVMIAIN